MKTSLRALLSGVIDYAGLFPPAKLPLDEAIRNYARYRTEPESWMLGRFICPAGRLQELESFADVLSEGPPFTFSALGRGGNTPEETVTGLRQDLIDIAAFCQRQGDRVVVDVCEVRFPPEFATLRPHPEFYRAVAGVLREFGREDLGVFFEISPSQYWGAYVRAATEGMPEANCRFGIKLRCGGTEAAAFPSVDYVRDVLAWCRSIGAPLKFTAGLHHPVRHFDSGLRARMHGFLNLFVAGVFAHAHPPSSDDIKQWIADSERLQNVIAEEDASSFGFDDDGLRWKDSSATVAEITAARQQLVISFGSCSFDEPRDDLRALGLL